MDEYERFQQLCAHIVSKRLSDGVPTSIWTADSGLRVEGWLVEQYERHRHEYFKSRSDWKDETRDGSYVLGTDGEIYQFVHWTNADPSTPQGESGREMWRMNASQLKGKTGPLFVQFSQKIRRMKW